jgi:hypothetical protein
MLITFVSSLAIIFTRPVHVSTTSDGTSRLVDTGTHIVQTGSAQDEVELADLPKLASPDTYNRIRSVAYYKLVSADSQPVKVVSKLETWTWACTSWASCDARMTLALADGTTIRIDQEGTINFVPKPTIKMSFDTSDNDILTPSNMYLPESGTIGNVTSKCAEVGCPLTECTAMLSANRGFTYQLDGSDTPALGFHRYSAFAVTVMCDAMPVWEWAQDPPLSTPAEGRRQLDYDCYVDCHTSVCGKMRWVSDPEGCSKKAYDCLKDNNCMGSGVKPGGATFGGSSVAGAGGLPGGVTVTVGM